MAFTDRMALESAALCNRDRCVGEHWQSMGKETMTTSSAARWLAVLLVGAAVAGCVPPIKEPERYLVYFDDVSVGAHAIRLEGRASATGSLEGNKRLAEARTEVVADALQHDGIPPAIITSVPVGQATSNDRSVNERRVEIILEP
jgi:hypothetical protein